MKVLLYQIAENPVYLLAVWFLAAFPILIAALAINSSRQYLLDRSRNTTEHYLPHQEELILARRRWPLVSIVIPARNEQAFLAETIRRSLILDWPEVEVIVINDGSLDGTQQIIEGFSEDQRVKTISHIEPRGKSTSLNEGIDLAQSEIVVIMDADAVPARNAVNRLVTHFMLSEEIAAVTGNPRVIHTPNLLSKLQAVEFSSTISTLRRGQSAWGRVNTMSGILTAIRKSIVQELGGFAIDQPTEDIELTWRLHRYGYRCIYEPAALVGMHVPLTLRAWFKQRLRWAKGLVRVLQRHGFAIIRKNEWPVYPLLLEATLAIIWCHLLILMTIFWAVGLIYGVPDLGNSLILNHWGFMTVGVAIVQILWGIHLDSNHDSGINKLRILAPIYPLVYWFLSAITVVLTTIPTLVTRPKHISWSSERIKS
jgi:biofilm PGA synthesis N-glycosyltransferase PgaC